MESYSNLQPHGHLVSFSSCSLDVDLPDQQHPNLCGLNPYVCLSQDFSPHSVLAADGSRALPPMSTFHRSSTAPRGASETSAGEIKHQTCGYIQGCLLLVDMSHKCLVVLFPVSGSQRNVSGGSQTGDTLGKALASVSMHHCNPIRAAHPRRLCSNSQQGSCTVRKCVKFN